MQDELADSQWSVRYNNMSCDDGSDGGDGGDGDIYIMVKCLFVCMFVTKNHHFHGFSR